MLAYYAQLQYPVKMYRPPEAALEHVLEPGRLTVIVGLQSGDEGKGKIAALLAKDFDTIASGNGGPNAGHSLDVEGIGEIKTHLLPAAIAYPDKLGVLGNGKLVSPLKFKSEKNNMESKGLVVSPARVAISGLAHFIKPSDVFKDALREKGRNAQGSTKSGIPYAASDKALRSGLRVEAVLKENAENDIFDFAYKSLCEGVKARRWRDRIFAHVSARKMKTQARAWTDAAMELKPYVKNTVRLLNDKLNLGENILVEGAQGFWLDPNHGKWPDVTSTGTTTAGILEGLGVAPQKVERVIGVAKLTKSQVGGRPFITQIHEENLAEKVRGDAGKPGYEEGTTTGRKRAVGYFDLVELKNSVEGNGVTELAITKMDYASRFGKTMKVAVAYRHIMTDKLETYAPTSMEDIAQYEPVYEEFITWGDISNIRNYDDLPAEAKVFVEFVENHLNVRVTLFGVGPKDEEIIIRP